MALLKGVRIGQWGTRNSISLTQAFTPDALQELLRVPQDRLAGLEPATNRLERGSSATEL